MRTRNGLAQVSIQDGVILVEERERMYKVYRAGIEDSSGFEWNPNLAELLRKSLLGRVF